MASKRYLLGMLLIVLVFGLFLFGCTTNVASRKETNFEKKPMGLIGVPKYTVLGAVTLEKKWFGILGLSIPSKDRNFYLYQSGGVTYVDLLTEAKKLFIEADAVIDIKIDYSGSKYWFFYSNRKNIVSGIAIKYSRDEVDYPEKNDVYIIKEK